MDQLPAFGKAIQDIVLPTFQTYKPLLEKNADFIRSASTETFQYGSHERQSLDVYYPSQPSIVNGRRPVLLFEYGGGLVQGAKSIPPMDGLCYANLGAFFSLNFGYTVVIADYRLMSHGAKFPSGGEDISLAIEWICKNKPGPGDEPIDLFAMGNSAGGIHLSTFLLRSEFAETRRKLLTGTEIRLRGIVFLSVPFNFANIHESRTETLKEYFGDIPSHAPLGLLKAARQQQIPLDFITAECRVAIINGELDPEDEILQPRDEFIAELFQMTDQESRAALTIDWMPRHNHISPAPALGTGVEQEEAWGCQVAGWWENIRKFPLREGVS
ncbi:hypothetical protein KC340_g7054 [Hortaea werneckii]|nr:hypothetical protein KC342_g7287 [Hortaea werneckii]KAI7233818.1 hypothetical protein KC365_g6216 [Hortaea werneckii]KAI7322393.1 hypothetical protein KC340_g7054 [Hortaea werneckii]KAI7401939.1 hypothetical protein KC328_g3017 [Hortaea werneckii]KAI7483672.1 hypothetical protein KC351_g5028 [Hortaea werneckii]